MSILVGVAAALVVCGFAASVQAVTGFGFALVAVPLLAIVVEPVEAVVVVTIVSLGLTTLAARRERTHVLRGPAVRMIIGGLVGMPLGLVALVRLDGSALRIVIAVVITGLVILLALRVRLGSGPRSQWGAGVVSGALLTSTGLNGPPLVLTLQSMEVTPAAFRGTLQRVFQGQDVVAVLAFAAVGRVDLGLLALALVGTAAVPMGWAWGDRLFGRISPETFRVIVLVTLLVAAGTSVVLAV